MKKVWLAAVISSVLLSPASFANNGDKIVVAHRGASGYLPEHTLPAKALAYAMKPDYIEQDVVMTKDDQLVVLHDHYLDRVTDVAEVFPNRARKDGRYYAIDFTLAEIKQLSVTEGFNLKDGKQVQGFPERYPMWQSNFTVPTLQEEIEMIQGLNKTLGYDIGIYPEIKAPWFHRHEGKDISKAVLEVLKEYGYTSKDSKVYVQTFDFNELKRIHDELLPAMKIDLKLVQLMAYTDWNETMVYDKDGKAQPYSYDWMFKTDGMKTVAKYADGIGPWKPMVVSDQSSKGNIKLTGLVKAAHAQGMAVHPYTFRKDEGRIPAYAEDFADMLDIFYNTANVDGVFTDFPNLAVDFISERE
ncbi:glycerophosphoryl diester phosphodiesterase [Photobacterium jeanii]|uniref:glycerophosphodiester phosphodiesterase n=1 Tax=Photobacterium jeanii TaxID=858640 RepID=A0A178KNX7_9GAMM|nr:glycerophosphodiester phosphodiesterase [Photobacterium jeanii]OAN18454.1 glycerophosphoryl diester phosphodiesterase [Photobacterium jeanii]PST91865.1 glycerophosphodiester phosphodiesterase [Photobacterium jeanii]